MSGGVTEVGVKLVRRGSVHGDHPGHMGVFWRQSGEMKFRGFVFDPEELPVEYQPMENWREYLFNNCVSGYVVEDDHLAAITSKGLDDLICKKPTVFTNSLASIEEDLKPNSDYWYSFNPDHFDDCHNCVTWATCSINRYSDGYLEPVENGRISEMAMQLEEKE